MAKETITLSLDNIGYNLGSNIEEAVAQEAANVENLLSNNRIILPENFCMTATISSLHAQFMLQDGKPTKPNWGVLGAPKLNLSWDESASKIPLTRAKILGVLKKSSYANSIVDVARNVCPV